MKKYDILVIGELCVDLIFNNIESLPEIGKETLAGNLILTMGSSSAIFASNASSLGADVTFLGKIGKDYFGDLMLDALKVKNVDIGIIIQSDKYVTGATVVLNYEEDRAMITHPGAMDYLLTEEITDEILQSAGHLHISSVFLQPGISADLAGIFSRAKHFGLTTSLDTQWDPREQWIINCEEVLKNVDLFIPNEAEILAITKQENIEAAVSKLSSYANTIIVKMGRKGSIAYKDGEFFSAKPFLNTNVIDAIGAGDSFDAGLVCEFLKGGSIEECLRQGNLAGALNTTAPGGTTAFESPEKIKQVALEKFGVII